MINVERQIQPSTANSVKIPIFLSIAVWTRIAVIAIGIYFWRLELSSCETARAIGTVVGGWRDITYKHLSPQWELNVLLLMLLPYLLSGIIMIFHKRKGMFCLASVALVTAIIDICVIVDFNLSYSIHGTGMLAFLLNVAVIFATEDYWHRGWPANKESKPNVNIKPWYTYKRNLFVTLVTSALAPIFVANFLAASTHDKSFGVEPMMLIGFIQACSVSLDYFWRWNIIVMFTAMIARVLYEDGLVSIFDPQVGLYGIFLQILANAIIYCILTLPVAGIIYYIRKRIDDKEQKQSE